MAADEVVVPRVCLGIIAREQISLPTHIGIIQSMGEGLLAYHLAVSSGPYLDAGRNKAVANGLQVGDENGDLLWDWFMFVDSDIEFRPDDIRTLFAPTLHPSYNPTRYPIIGGVYVNPFDDKGVPGETPSDYSGFFGPVCYEWTEVDDLPGELYGTMTPNFRRLSRTSLAQLPPVNEAWNPPSPNGAPSPVCQVGAIGTGFLAIHSSLLRTMAEHYGEPLPWFDEPVRHGVHYGEDMGFALRAMDLGYPVLAHRGCTPMHNKTTKLV